uniref:Small ribosomal subunit protein cS23 n=2 Tax=Euglena viridis TaxID=3040 RepID=RRP3_EUGVI|nr:RecName: Full=Small ribosomal subunit protein cS23; AltName: Full=30S ribosomal protein 3, chloroplastic; Short=PSRP-3 [Euglena viridis]AAK27696.1 ycf65 [Euglena viridis]ABB02368.1 Ycf65 [Euglena viridis]
MQKFVLKFLWLQRSVAVSLDQKIGDNVSPLTEFYFWPQCDAWEEMRNFLESKSWINSSESILLLNQVTEIINDWQEKDDSQRKDIFDLKEKFPFVDFIGFD